MKIFLVSDYFYPFNPGGSEWSVYELAKSLKKRDIEPIIITLNYGARAQEIYDGLKVRRLAFVKKIGTERKVVNPIWQNNPIFFTASAFQIYKTIMSEKPDVIHVHGKFLIPGAIIAGLITKIPVIVTIRDKQIICPIGKCFFEKNRLKACELGEYITSDLPWYYANYSQHKSFMNFTYIALGAIYNKFMFAIIKFFAKRAKIIMTISQSQKEYLEKNGFSNLRVIYNTASFSIPQRRIQKSKSILFAGKLSKGKCGEILINSIPDLVKKNKIVFLFAGTIELKKMFSEKLGKKTFKKYIKVLKNLSHPKLTNLYSKVTAIVMPSIYPESFGRVALEAIAQGTPAIVTNIGGLPEIVQDKVTGRVVNPNEHELKNAIKEVVENEKIYNQNIKRLYPSLREKFHDIPIEQHLKIYRSLFKT